MVIAGITVRLKRLPLDQYTPIGARAVSMHSYPLSASLFMHFYAKAEGLPPISHATVERTIA